MGRLHSQVKIHFIQLREDDTFRNLCIPSEFIVHGKATFILSHVTCKRCFRKLAILKRKANDALYSK